MSNEKMYSANEVCEVLNITRFTLSNWYNWEKKQLASGSVSEPYLPIAIRLEHTKGSPRRWTESMVNELKQFQSKIITGRNGVYGVYSNPHYKETKKYKKSIETVDNK